MIPNNLSQSLPTNIDLQIDPRYQDRVPTTLLALAVQVTLQLERVPHGEVTLVIGDDDLLRQLNRDYRGIDEVTDVLSFAAREQPDAAQVPFVTAPEAENYLGDVVISFSTAARQAAEAGQSPEQELCLLAVHGVLHLLGYDHATPEEEEAMWAIQDAVLAGLSLSP